jgi:hypothetical protein
MITEKILRECIREETRGLRDARAVLERVIEKAMGTALPHQAERAARAVLAVVESGVVHRLEDLKARLIVEIVVKVASVGAFSEQAALKWIKKNLVIRYPDS